MKQSTALYVSCKHTLFFLYTLNSKKTFFSFLFFLQTFSDIKLVCKDGEFYAHKVLLSRCEYFMALLRMQSGEGEILSLYSPEDLLHHPHMASVEPRDFDPTGIAGGDDDISVSNKKDDILEEKKEEEEMDEEEVEVLYLNDVSKDVLYPILTAVYTGKTVVVEDPDIYVPLLMAADELGVEEAREWCEREIIKNVEPESVVFLFRLADLHNAPNLRRHCFNYIIAHFEEVNKIYPVLFEDKHGRHFLQGSTQGVKIARPEDLLLTNELRAEIYKEIKDISTKKKILLERYENANELYYEAQILSGRLLTRKEFGKAFLGISTVGLVVGLCYWLSDS